MKIRRKIFVYFANKISVNFISVSDCVQKNELSVFGGDYPTQDGSCVRDYIDVRDLVRAHVLALDFKAVGKTFDDIVFNLGTGKGVSVFEVVNKVEEITGKPLDVNVNPRREGDATALYADPRKAKSILGWNAEYSLEDSILERYRYISK